MNELSNVNNNKQLFTSAIPQEGMEDMLQEDIMIPRAKLLQALSPEVVEGRQGCRAGVYINSLTGDVLPHEFVPVMIGYQWIKFNPSDPKDPAFNPGFKPNEIIHRTTDPNDPIVVAEGKFGENGEKPTITKFMNFLCLFPGQTVPLVISFAKTSYKSGRLFANLIRLKGGRPFDHKYALTCALDKNDAGQQYYVMKVAPIGPADESVKTQASQIYASLKGKNLNIHDESTATE